MEIDGLPKPVSKKHWRFCHDSERKRAVFARSESSIDLVNVLHDRLDRAEVYRDVTVLDDRQFRVFPANELPSVST